MKINGKRLLADLKNLREITATPGKGVTRFSYGQKDKKARKYIIDAAKAAGFVTSTDAIGNMYISCSDKKLDLSKKMSAESGRAEMVIVGSHIDTVKNGGWLDGIYGVIGAFETLRVINENNFFDGRSGGSSAKDRGLGLVIFAEEEGSNFGSCMTGSKFVNGVYSEQDLDVLMNDQGVKMRRMLEDCGYRAYRNDEVIWDFNRVKAMLELHIEQGPVLDEKKIPIGIVDRVNGMSVSQFTLTGVGNHAGGTPMSYRHDALATAALCIAAVESIANNDSDQVTVATVGKLNVSPNCSNVIPEQVTFTVEVRDVDVKKIDKAMDAIKSEIFNIAKKRGVECEVREAAYSLPIKMDESIKRIIEEKASESDLDYLIMNSGAVHDACMIAAHSPAGMIFVPSKEGRSHVPYEDTDEKDLIKGAQLLLDTVLGLFAD
ncbi:MAG TPA: M20 family metallo-hydrolase [Anaerovoracaceae bacterium]|nr:M20 family metallo-hydrolase [Anaerovoracaceae bacterium]